MRILDKNTFCPDCGTGMCYVKKFRDGHTNYFCGCRQSIWQEEYYETPCTNKSCAEKDAELTRLREAVEWACGYSVNYNYDTGEKESINYRMSKDDRDELRRLAKEG